MDFPAHEGWVSLQERPDGVDGLHVRVQQRAGQLVITDLYVHGPELTPGIVRGLSVSRLLATLRMASMDLAVAHVDAQARARAVLASAGIKRPRLSRPGSSPPDEFYPRVAQAYAEYAPQTRAPAKEIATEAGVPVTTAHRWIREARRRGFLPSAKQGRAG